jgi:hypothetical protein
MLVVSYLDRGCSRGTIVAQGQHEANYRHDLAIYVGLALALLVGISGTASIVDGVVHWANVFKGFLEIYRVTLHEPIAWVVNLAWPTTWSAIPARAIDLFVVWSAFYLAVNINDLKINGKIFITNATAGSSFLESIAIVLLSFLLIPLVVLYTFACSGRHLNSNEAKVSLIYVFVLIGVVFGLAFLNWELRGVVQ